MNNKNPPILSREDCEKILYKCFNVPTQLHAFKISRISDKVLGFLGEHLQLNISYSLKNEPWKVHETTFFIKALPQLNDKQKKYITAMGIFQKEMLVYKNLFSKLQKYVTRPFAPECYFIKPDHCMVLEDVRLKSFRVAEYNLLNMEQCKAALETIARFHASSLIFEELQSTTDDKVYRIGDHFTEEVTESTFSFIEGHPRNMWAKTSTDCLIKLSKYFTNDKEIAQKLSDYVFKEIQEYLKPSKRYRNVVTHDDLWNNNMMFNDQNECILVDFQLTRYTPPIFDVLLALYINLKRDFLQENMSMLLDFYYASVEKALVLKNLNPEKVFPKNDFLESVKIYSKPALMESAMYGTNTFLPEDVSVKVIASMDVFEEFTFRNRSPFVLHEYENNLEYKERFDHVLIPLFNSFK